MRVKARMPREPISHRGCLVRAVVVHDQMYLKRLGHVSVDRAQELQELFGAVATVKFADDLAGGHVQRSKQRGGPMSHVVMGTSLRYPRSQRQDRLCAIQRLDLALLVNAQHQGLGRRVQVKPDDIAHLVDKQRVRGELEGLGSMRLQPESAPHTTDRTLRELELARHGPRAAQGQAGPGHPVRIR